LEALATGRSAWPDVGVDREEFARHLASAGVAPAALVQHAADLYLACACGRGDPTALARFEQQFLEPLPRHLSRFSLTQDRLEAVRQAVRIRLFAGPDARIGHYAGTGPLGAWVRVLAIRVALDLLDTRAIEARSDSEALVSLVTENDNPELALMREQLKERFQGALEESLASLSPREKTLLRMHFVDGLNIDAIGAVFKVHRATVARWLLAIRGAIVDRMRAQVGIGIRPTSTGFRSVVALVRDDLHLSLGRLLVRERAP
jgi:RNA polymerase sigma-70 factor (ECF subfamily)